MNKLWWLIQGELVRLVKYKIIYFGVAVSLIWILVIAFQDANQARQMLPLLVVTDAGMMSVILLGTSFYYEKQEHTIQSLLMAPLSLTQILISKMVTAICLALVSLIIVGGFAVVFHQLSFQLILLLLAILVVVLSHTAIGYLLILSSKDFLSMLVKFAGVMLLFYTPTFLLALQVIPADLSWLALLSPSYAGEYLIRGSFMPQNMGYMVFGFIYLFLLGSSLYVFYVYPRFKKQAVEGV
jgi:fluoroquinolone transport system permease protein